MTAHIATADELAPWRRRVARAALIVAALDAALMLSALPMDAFELNSRREDDVALAVLLSIVIASTAAFVALGRRARSGRFLAWGLGAYALLMLGSKAIAFARLSGPQRSDVPISSLIVSGIMFAALMVAALACLPYHRAREAESIARAV